MLIIPAMYVALNQGVEIFDAQGALIAGDKLIFTVLPQLFDSMGQIGIVVALAFFCLMVIAALTSSISMLEVPVAYLVENKNQPRSRAVWLVAVSIFLFSSLISFNFDDLFGFIVSLSTKYSQPLVGIIICVFVGWLWRRDAILRELATNDANIEQSVFWKIWPWYIKFVCPVIVGFMFVRSIL
jgi:NSS family neurotransmitter:Na+ symporter